MFEIEGTYTLTVTETDIDDIVCTALEGGITYWCNKAEVVGDYLGDWAHEQISKGGTLIFHDTEEDEKYELTRDKLLNGIKLAYEQNWFSSYGWTDGKVLDTCQIDADVADTIIQLALFEEVIYG